MTFDEKIGDLICTWRKKCDMSQSMLAEACGVSQATISKMESGRQAPSLRQLLDILQATGNTLLEVAPSISEAADVNQAPLWERFDDQNS